VFQRNARFSEGADPVPELGAADSDLEKVYDFYEQPGQNGDWGISRVFLYPLVIKHGLLENPPLMIFSQS
jgi:hypothetical protein